jgi:hypothetical protein
VRLGYQFAPQRIEQVLKAGIEMSTELTEVAPAIQRVYPDLLQPGVVQVGKAIGDILEGMLLPITEWKEKRKALFQRRMEIFRSQLEGLPQEKIAHIPSDLGLPVLEKLSYIEDEVISQLFLNLLATAANEETQNMAHPSFMRVIESLSADEAKLLLNFREKNWVICMQWMRENTKTGIQKFYGARYGRLAETQDLQFPKNMEVYLSNFVGLGIVTRSKEQIPMELQEERGYHDDLSQMSVGLNREIDEDSRFAEHTDAEGIATTECILLTAYGNMFLKACLRKIET